MPEVSLLEFSYQSFYFNFHVWRQLCFQGCAHVEAREVQGVILPLRNVQTCRSEADELSSVNGQIANIVSNEGHLVSVPINIKAALATV